MPSRQQEFAERSDFTATAKTATFTPPFATDTWQLRLSNASGANVVFTVATVDEAGVSISIDGSPFTVATGTGAMYLITSHCPTLTVVSTSGVALDATHHAFAACKAWSDSQAGSPGAYTARAVT